MVARVTENASRSELNKDVSMLVLSRKKDETITLTFDGTEITISILKIKRNGVSVGIEADDFVQISRGKPECRSEPKANSL